MTEAKLRGIKGFKASSYCASYKYGCTSGAKCILPWSQVDKGIQGQNVWVFLVFGQVELKLKAKTQERDLSPYEQPGQVLKLGSLTVCLCAHAKDQPAGQVRSNDCPCVSQDVVCCKYS